MTILADMFIRAYMITYYLRVLTYKYKHVHPHIYPFIHPNYIISTCIPTTNHTSIHILPRRDEARTDAAW